MSGSGLAVGICAGMAIGYAMGTGSVKNIVKKKIEKVGLTILKDGKELTGAEFLRF